jgi:hypothetical protein
MNLQLLWHRNGTQAGMRPVGLVLAVWIAVCISGTASTAWAQQATRTQLSMNSETQGAGGQTTLSANVAEVGGSPVTSGTVSFETAKGSLGSAFVQNGQATLKVDHLPAGTAQVTAVYHGEGNLSSSAASVHADAAQADASLPDFSITANPTSLSLSPGQYGTVVLTITPENGFNSMVTLSCSGNPTASTCAFTPTTLTPMTANAVTSSLQIQTQGGSGTAAENKAPRMKDASHIAFAFVLPGALVLIGLGTVRRRSGLAGLRVIGFVALLAASSLGLSACAARYDYLHHPPSANPGVAAGSYTVTVSAYSTASTGVTSHTVTLALTIK